MSASASQHPLSQLLVVRGWTAEDLLRRIAAEHRALGFGQLAARKEKVSRWVRPVRPAIPNERTQLSLASTLGIPRHEVHSRGWPHWLQLALRDDHAAWESPWTPQGTLSVLDDAGGPVERRGFLTATTGTLAAVLAQWATAQSAVADSGIGRRINASVADRIDSRLAELRRLDDDLGAHHVYDAARAELGLVTRLLRDQSYTEETGRRLYACASEASRLAGWCAYDDGRLADAERHFVGALRASGSAGDRTAGAIAAGFWANARYGATVAPDPQGAVQLIDTALTHRTEIPSPRALAMLYIRKARAHSLTREPTAAYRAIDDALAAYESGGLPAHEDAPSLYWMTAGEVFQAAASSALSLKEPARALSFFDAALAHPDPYDAQVEPRGAAIYSLRRARAYFALGDLDGAVESGQRAVHLMGGVHSARGNSTLKELRTDLRRHRGVPAVASFLEATR